MRKSGWVHYDEIILAMLYWNKERNIVPQKQMELRKGRDDVIKYEVDSLLSRPNIIARVLVDGRSFCSIFSSAFAY
jgi:hypothetical protein